MPRQTLRQEVEHPFHARVGDVALRAVHIGRPLFARCIGEQFDQRTALQVLAAQQARQQRRGGDTAQTRIQFIHERIGVRLPLIGVGNLFSADEILEAAFESGLAEFIGVGKTVMVNPNLATLVKEGREAEIAKLVGPGREDHYGFPDMLWNFTAGGTQP